MHRQSAQVTPAHLRQGLLRTRLRSARWKLLLGSRARYVRGFGLTQSGSTNEDEALAYDWPDGPGSALNCGFAPVCNSALSLDALRPAAFSPVLLSQESPKVCLMN